MKNNPEKSDYTGADILDENIQRERILSQDKRLLDAASAFATKINMLPPDPEFPDIEPRALLVGGFVRDALRGEFPKDADVEVYGVSAARLESVLDQVYGGGVNKIGKSFGIFKIDVGEGLDLDISIPRRESKVGSGHKGFSVDGDPTMSVEEAARRRDFTFNALAADIFTGEVSDPFGGVNDLREELLKVTDPERFQDDPLRVYRAVQFVGRMGLSVEPDSQELMCEMVERGDLEELVPERVTEELKKLFLKAEQPSAGFELARELGIIEKYYPELHALIGTEQEVEWHPEGDVWTHTMVCLDAGAKLIRQEDRGLSEADALNVMVGILCHDLGKPSTTEVVDGRIRSWGHEGAGVEPTKQFGKRLSFSLDTIDAAKKIAENHLAPNFLYRELRDDRINEKQYANAVRRLLRKIYPLTWQAFITACEADSRGRGFDELKDKRYETREIFARVIQEHELDKEPRRNLVAGRDIIATAKELGVSMKPGPVFGELIETIEEERDGGAISTREEGLELLRELVSKKGA